MNSLDGLVKKHRDLDFLLENKGNTKDFVSDWNCKHPFYHDYFNQIRIPKDATQKYNFIRAEDDIYELITKFHLKNEKKNYHWKEIIIGNGSATIISAFFVWLKLQGIEYVYYIPPLYYTFHFFSRVYEIPLRPITNDQLLSDDVPINLPKKKCVLILSDPIWYAGYSINKKTINKIVKWQKQTQSTVFVDGSFQYFNWDLTKNENTSNFDRQNTFRLVCPSKAVATHGLRFSYLILPKKYFDTLDFILDNSLGSSNPYDIVFAKKCMKLLLSRKSNNELIIFTEKIYSKLLQKQIISSSIKANCGYFIFAKPNKMDKKLLRFMDGKYFEQKKFNSYVRVNLLGSAIRKYL